ncbi:hypothetical protein MtrunA17_Chr8g0371021 [Medicago truncatula]|uniref:Transmembrane protein n=1 Tax=Medicago truncatula TaxID=3880 RepID=A0A396GLB4_MEDTR|nr:hypothetical protein MtrunA17_Chr8g0371021 [Medicago truncatula]
MVLEPERVPATVIGFVQFLLVFGAVLCWVRGYLCCSVSFVEFLSRVWSLLCGWLPSFGLGPVAVWEDVSSVWWP